ncbi:hypothetical protein [Cellvibrio sp. KY-GH-1]|uniref:hypothetical protein n=1 Tax=Cellvibrio sp. KY-GH-1 TaxID=2303332 RepID=UPI001CD9921F|nr:hypothetical protein [Cellvibrio sp. KY-GH-1]
MLAGRAASGASDLPIVSGLTGHLGTMIKPTKTRRQLHQELEEQIRQYLDNGGQVSEVPRGLSGRMDASGPLVALFEGSSHEDRTPLPDVVAAIEARKKPTLLLKPKKPKPRKKVILDDFGQPLRWEWVED